MPLHGASRTGTAVMHILISRGANVNATDDNGLTASHTAAYAGNNLGIELLLANGTDLLARTKLGRSAMDLAAMRGHETTALTLIKH